MITAAQHQDLFYAKISINDVTKSQLLLLLGTVLGLTSASALTLNFICRVLHLHSFTRLIFISHPKT